MATTPNFLENFALSRSFALGKNFSLAAKKEISHLTPKPILRASESLCASFLQTLGATLLFVLLLQPLAPWPSRPSFQNHTWEKTFPLPTSHLEKTTSNYDAVSGSSLYCNGDPVNGLDPDGRCVEGASAGWANGNGQFAGTYDSSQASSQLAYGLGWTVGGALGTINGMAASLTTRPLAAMGQGYNEVTDFAEENLNLAPGSLTAATFMFAPLAVAGEANEIAEAGIVAPNNIEVRKFYLNQLSKIPNQIDASLPLREQAIQAFNLRNAVKIEARSAMTDQEAAILLNRTDPIPTIQDIVRKVYKEKGLIGDDLWKNILESSTRSRSSINQKLGVGN